MDDLGLDMEIIDQRKRTLLSAQVARARYFFGDLRPNPSGKFRPAFGGRERCHADYLVQRSSFEFCVLEHVVAGEGHAILNGKQHALAPGVIFSYARSTQCEIRSSKTAPLEKYFLCFDGRSAPEKLKKAGVAVGTACAVTSAFSLLPIWEELITEGQSHSTDSEVLCGFWVELLLRKLAACERARSTADSLSHQSFLRCKTLIDADAEKLSTLEELATRTQLDPATVCRLFRKYHSDTPYSYLLRRKMARAAEHLLKQGALVKEAAAQVGFSDPLHFSRVFRKYLGVPPSQIQPSIKRADRV